MTRKFTIKKEIRSLGIDTCKPGRMIGAVVRGGLYLDGIVKFSSKSAGENPSIAREILGTRFYPELKLIMTHDPERKLDARMIEKETGLPVIEVRTRRDTRSNGFEPFHVGRRTLQIRTSLETSIVEKIFERTWTMGQLPEPLRVAHLIAGSRFREKPGDIGLTDKFGS